MEGVGGGGGWSYLGHHFLRRLRRTRAVAHVARHLVRVRVRVRVRVSGRGRVRVKSMVRGRGRVRSRGKGRVGVKVRLRAGASARVCGRLRRRAGCARLVVPL